jgi:hypothetical protein
VENDRWEGIELKVIARPSRRVLAAVHGDLMPAHGVRTR